MPDRKWIILGLIIVLLLIAISSLDRGTGWAGVDTAVVGRYATEAGREPWKPLVDLRGDALLFAFSISAAIGGFIAGYCWRGLFGSSGNSSVHFENDARRKDTAQDV